MDRRSKSSHDGTTNVTRQCLQGNFSEKIHQIVSEWTVHSMPAAACLQGTSCGICAASCISKPCMFQTNGVFTLPYNDTDTDSDADNSGFNSDVSLPVSVRCEQFCRFPLNPFLSVCVSELVSVSVSGSVNPP